MPVNHSEEILNRLARKSFLSLWSYPNPYVDKGSKDGKKELTDLLVVFGNHVLAFSVKDCEFKDTGDMKKDWNRWKKKAVTKSFDQIRGAERFIKKYPDRIYLNKECNQKIYAPLPPLEDLQFHGIIVANGAREVCEKHHKQSGSLIISSHQSPIDCPFMVEQPDDDGSFIHVLDEYTLDIVMGELDTIADFVRYLCKKEDLIKKGKMFNATGEEELLAFYLQVIGPRFY